MSDDGLSGKLMLLTVTLSLEDKVFESLKIHQCSRHHNMRVGRSSVTKTKSSKHAVFCRFRQKLRIKHKTTQLHAL